MDRAYSAKQPPPRPPAPPSKIPPLQVTRSLATSLAADSNSPSAPIFLAEVATAPAASPAALSVRRSPAMLVAVGAGSALILAISFGAGWFAMPGVSPQTAAALESGSPGAEPQPLDRQLAALQQQAKQLRRELAEAKQKLKARSSESAAPPAEQPTMPEPSEKNELSAANDSPLADDSGAKPAARKPAGSEPAGSEPDAEATASEREAKSLPAGQVEQANGSRRVEFLFGLVQGKTKVETYRDVYEQARKAAGDAWPPDCRPHPLAGLWKGKENWEIEIDPRRERIVFRRTSPEATFEQRICKIGPDHLVTYEKRKVPIERMATDPFRTEKYDGDDRFPSPDDAMPDEAIAFTYYSQSKGGAALQIRRRIHSANWVQESDGRELWKLIGNPKKYREFRAAYRRAKD